MLSEQSFCHLLFSGYVSLGFFYVYAYIFAFLLHHHRHRRRHYNLLFFTTKPAQSFELLFSRCGYLKERKKKHSHTPTHTLCLEIELNCLQSASSCLPFSHPFDNIFVMRLCYIYKVAIQKIDASLTVGTIESFDGFTD